MRTTIELPDPLYRKIKSQAARAGLPMNEFVRQLLERGLIAGTPVASPGAARSAPPRLRVGQPLRRVGFSNAGLCELLDDSAD